MKHPNYINQLLQDFTLGYCYLDNEFRIVDHNKICGEHLGNVNEILGHTIFALAPHLLGMESLLSDLALGKKRYFNLEKINIHTNNNEILYLNYHLYATGDSETPILLITQDTTENTKLQQQLNQQRYELTLLQSRQFTNNNPLGSQLLGESPAIKNVRNQINYVSRVQKATILLEGESGTGKSMIARILHSQSFEEDKPFVEINCAAIPETLLEAELFGHEKGAFTHAVTSKPGLLEEADGGTLFLDEISEMPLKIQVKLLTFLETRKFRRLGSTKEIKVEIKLITATNQNLMQQVKNSKFREDLYYRLNVVNIVLPPLREIGQDILTIAENFIKYFNIEFNKKIIGFTPEAASALLDYHWPGNVRELRNTVERAMIFASDNRITRDNITTLSLQDNIIKDTYSLPPEGLVFEDLEKKILQDALCKAGNNQTKAAKLLHMSRDTFRYRLEKHQLLDN